MKKMKRYALLLAGLTLLSLAGCGTTQTPSAARDNPPFADTPADATSATEISDDITAEESAPPTAESELPAIAEQTPSQTAEKKAEERPPIENMAAPPPAQSEQPRETQLPRQTETPKPEEPKPDPPQPVQSQTPALTEPEPPAKQPDEEPAVPEFNIQTWIDYAKTYAVSVGLKLESSAVDCWDNPIIAGAHSSCLQRDIESRLNRYSRDEDITDVWIWAQERSDGSYDLYIGYA